MSSVVSLRSAEPDIRLMVERLVTLLQRYAFLYANEEQLHRGIAEALTAEGVVFQHEQTVGDDRFDFLCAGGVVIEVKMDRGPAQAYRQVDRYCQSSVVSAVIVATTKAWTPDPIIRTELRSKPVLIVRIKGRAF